MFDFELIKKQIDFEYEYGIRDFEITGGEPSEYKNIRKVCEYIKEKDPNSKIAIITNGGLFGCDVWDLLDEVLISYHLGKNVTGTDMTIFPRGSTFEKVSRTIEKARENNVFIRTNSVLGTFNLGNVDEIVKDLISFKPRIINFLPVNLFDEATSMISFIDYRELRPIIKRTIDTLKNNLPDTLVFVRYMPFCDMEGYEQHIVGHLQHIYDWFDWNRELDGIQFLNNIDKNPHDVYGRYGSKSIETCFKQRPGLYEKSNKCLFCRYNILCDGVEKSNGRLLDQIVPSKGQIIKNPLEFIGTVTHDLYRKIYA